MSGNEYPILDLTDLPIGEKYLSPIPIAYLASSRGCYWNKCAFCDQSEHDFRRLPSDIIIKTLQKYQQQGVKIALFCDESIPPKTLKLLVEEIPKTNIRLLFCAASRIEKQLLPLIGPAANIGLKFITFGIESGCARITELMEKGYSHDTAQAVLEECFQHGIFTRCSIMFGFPSETSTEAFETIKFLETNLHRITFIKINFWHLMKNSPIGKNSDAYGIVSASRHGIFEGEPDTYKVLNGMTLQEAREFVEKLKKTHPALYGKSLNSFDFTSSDKLKTEEYVVIERVIAQGELL